MSAVTEAERKFLDESFHPSGGTAKEQGEAILAARFAVLKERLPNELIEQCIRLRADYHKLRERDSAMWQKLSSLGFEDQHIGRKLWKFVDEQAKKVNAGDPGAATADFGWDDCSRCP